MQRNENDGQFIAFLSDLRVMIGGLFSIIGAVLTIAGKLDSQPTLISQINHEPIFLNQIAGKWMLSFGVVMIVWSVLSFRKSAEQSKENSKEQPMNEHTETTSP